MIDSTLRLFIFSVLLVACDDPAMMLPGDGGTDADPGDAGSEPGNTSRIELPATPYDYAGLVLPAHFEVESEGFHAQQPMVATDNMPEDNPVTNEGATLGRVLFYDRNLSRNRTIACASCHKQEHGFSDDRVLSVGFEGGETRRHSMGLTNARYGMDVMFWDGRADSIEDQALMPLQDPVEMGMTLPEVEERVREADYYPPLFVAAFGDEEVTADRISRAIAQFVRSIVSTRSRYDVGRAEAPARSNAFSNFTDAENHGKFLFSSPPPLGGFGCFVCHQGEGFLAVEPTSNGLDAEITDRGLGEVTGSARHEGTFRVPSLRNVAVRAPYMHDGRFGTLEEVIDHYSNDVQPSPNLGPPFGVIDGEVPQLNMTDEEKTALVAFLRTLTDEELLSDPRFSDPFVRDDE
jgi:cytochrome c peroxidase